MKFKRSQTYKIHINTKYYKQNHNLSMYKHTHTSLHKAYKKLFKILLFSCYAIIPSNIYQMNTQIHPIFITVIIFNGIVNLKTERKMYSDFFCVTAACLLEVKLKKVPWHVFIIFFLSLLNMIKGRIIYFHVEFSLACKKNWCEKVY